MYSSGVQTLFCNGRRGCRTFVNRPKTEVFRLETCVFVSADDLLGFYALWQRLSNGCARLLFPAFVSSPEQSVIESASECAKQWVFATVDGECLAGG